MKKIAEIVRDEEWLRDVAYLVVTFVLAYTLLAMPD